MRERLPPREWRPLDTPSPVRSDPSTLAASTWHLGRIVVISTLAYAKLPDGSGELGPQWHISISSSGKRPKPHELRRALRAFNMVDAEEDNHHPGVARHFWMPVDPKRRVDCECKTTEVPMRDADGYRWTNDPVECRGCGLAAALARIGVARPCPVHASEGEVTRG